MLLLSLGPLYTSPYTSAPIVSLVPGTSQFSSSSFLMILLSSGTATTAAFCSLSTTTMSGWLPAAARLSGI